MPRNVTSKMGLGRSVRFLVILAVLLPLVSSFPPPFERLHWHVDPQKSGSTRFVKVPSVGSLPPSRWTRFTVNPLGTEIIVPGATYYPSATRRATGTEGVWEDTWYFETSVAVLRFRVDPQRSIGEIGLAAESDLWTQFRFVEFCPALGEFYLHSRELSASAMICAKDPERHVVMPCAEPLTCTLALQESGPERRIVNKTLPFSFQPEKQSPAGDLVVGLGKRIAFTLSERAALAHTPYALAVTPTQAILVESIDDMVNEHMSSGIVLAGYLCIYIYYLIHGTDVISVPAARTTACFVIFAVVHGYHHLTIVEKAYYFLRPYGFGDTTSPALVLLLALAVPIAASTALLLDAHSRVTCKTMFHKAARGLAVTLSSLLPAFFVLLVGMDKINIVMMAVIGGLMNIAIVRDVVGPVMSPQNIYAIPWAGLTCVGVLALTWVYVAVFFPFVSEVLLFATIPWTVGPFAIATHAAFSVYFTCRENMEWK